MKQELRAIRGMNDVAPPASARWQRLERCVAGVLASYGYQQIRLPILEATGVFERSIGDTTDIVQKEMYTFADRNGDSLSLRPEGTAGCVRAVLEHGLLNQQPQLRLWYAGPMFRHERPQKGRYRQFHQIGAEAFGLAGPDIDAEIILLTARLWRMLGLTDLRLELNTLGVAAERESYRTALREYFGDRAALLDEESRLRLERNPLRILDSKNPALRPLIDAAPRLVDHLGAESRAHFDAVCACLTAAGLEFVVNPLLVRGLDYYGKTVFEWITNELGAQGTVCAGGRYDGLVELMGGKPTPAIGFAMGLERLVELLAQRDEAIVTDAELCVVAASEAESQAALLLAEYLRDAVPAARTLCACGGGSMKALMKRADRSGAQFALILGGEELASGTVSLKPLRGQGEQRRIAREELAPTLSALLAGDHAATRAKN
ncbi:MAG TPA: histidine--tRNA ligase [Gammaproteobacteria bacterium]|nr:histidine--tRNA ligase [Gammaproteobacteria bacterium]